VAVHRHLLFRWTLLKEVTDDDIGNLAASGDARVSSTTNSYANQAVEFGQYEAADDGNVYLMRWTLPTIFYAISPGGKVVRRFVVDPGDEGFAPVAMHIASNRIAVLFFHEQTKEKRMKIVDLEGHEIATYEEARIGGKTKKRLSRIGICLLHRKSAAFYLPPPEMETESKSRRRRAANFG
jgi:hypothetical protein